MAGEWRECEKVYGVDMGLTKKKFVMLDEKLSEFEGILWLSQRFVLGRSPSSYRSIRLDAVYETVGFYVPKGWFPKHMFG